MGSEFEVQKNGNCGNDLNASANEWHGYKKETCARSAEKIPIYTSKTACSNTWKGCRQTCKKSAKGLNFLKKHGIGKLLQTTIGESQAALYNFPKKQKGGRIASGLKNLLCDYLVQPARL